jgi:uncharacterized protein (TIGR03435 family)
MKLRILATSLIWAAYSSAQGPSFDVVSVKAAAPGSRQTPSERERGFIGTGGRVDLRAVSMGSVLTRAFDLTPDQLSGPDWLNSQSYDISAVAPAGTPRDQILLMFQNLLADRFKLKYHRETAVTPVYALVADSKGVKLNPGIPDNDPDNHGQIAATSNAGGKVTASARTGFGIYTLTVADGVMHYDLQNIGMKDLARFLSQAGRRALGLPVIDLTEMKGRYQVALDISQSESHGPAPGSSGAAEDPQGPGASDPAGSSIRTSLGKQGLRLVRKNAPLEKFVVDQLERTPTAN